MSTSRAHAAEVAHAMSQCMNLLFLLAAPRLFESVRSSSPETIGDAPETLRRFVSTAEGIRSRSATLSGDVERVVTAAALVTEICAALPGAELGQGLPSAVVEPARKTLAVLGFPGPREGWDEFEAFSVLSPPLRS